MTKVPAVNVIMLKKTNCILRDSNTRFKAISFTVSSIATIFSWSLQSENGLPAGTFRHYDYDYYNYTRLMPSFQDNLGKPAPER